jgi:hypothetical protein
MTAWDFADKNPYVFLAALLIAAYGFSKTASQIGKPVDNTISNAFKFLVMVTPYIIRYKRKLKKDEKKADKKADKEL